MPPEVKAALSSADLISRTYTQNGDTMDFVLIGGTDRTALHDPRSCLVGAGWRLENDHTEALPGAGISVHACHAVGAAGQPGLDIVYLYVVDGRIIDQVTQIRAAMLWSALLGRKNTPVYFLRFTRPLSDDAAQQADRHTQLEHFAAQMWTALRPKNYPRGKIMKVFVADVAFDNVTMAEAVVKRHPDGTKDRLAPLCLHGQHGSPGDDPPGRRLPGDLR